MRAVSAFSPSPRTQTVDDGSSALRTRDLAFLFAATVLARVLLALAIPGIMYDSGVYFTTGANIAENGCVSASLPDSGACVPSWGGNHFPGYPLFIGAVFSLFPRSVAAVLIAQSVLTGVALFWLVTGVAHFTRSRRTSLIAGYVAGLSPATLPWSRMLLLECLLAACGIWLLGSLLRILAGRRTRLFAFVIPVAAATFLRPDSILLAIPVAIVFFASYTPRIAVAKLALIGLCVSAPILGWWVRSVRLGLPTLPVLAVPEGFRQPLGRLRAPENMDDAR